MEEQLAERLDETLRKATTAWTLRGRVTGLTTRNKKPLGAPGIATRSKDATRDNLQVNGRSEVG